MTTPYDPPAHRLWRVNRVTTTLAQLATECADFRLSRTTGTRMLTARLYLAQLPNRATVYELDYSAILKGRVH